MIYADPTVVQHPEFIGDERRPDGTILLDRFRAMCIQILYAGKYNTNKREYFLTPH
jgi:hypothetical protein